MVVDRSTTNNEFVWRVTIDTRLNTIYCLTGWVATLFEEVPAYLQIRIRGVQDNRTKTLNVRAPERVKSWKQFYMEWNSGKNARVTLGIID